MAGLVSASVPSSAPFSHLGPQMVFSQGQPVMGYHQPPIQHVQGSMATTMPLQMSTATSQGSVF